MTESKNDLTPQQEIAQLQDEYQRLAYQAGEASYHISTHTTKLTGLHKAMLELNLRGAELAKLLKD
jgi:hypothetical protein